MPEEPPALAPAVEVAPPPAERVVVSSVTMPGNGTAPTSAVPRASDSDRIRPEPVFFRLGAGYGAVGQIDLDACRDRGLDPGYVHMRVTFGGEGRVARAIVESLEQPPPAALMCISERLEKAAVTVPPFEGGDVTLSKSLYVATGGLGPAVLVESDVTPRAGAGRMTLAP